MVPIPATMSPATNPASLSKKRARGGGRACERRVPAVVPQLDDVTVLEGPIDAHAAMFMPPNGHQGLAQEVLISNVVAMPGL
ncbi:MAG: hypothetical protein CM15mP79_2530 [Methanobacteriota archaeon]|nr:MAG: hypothetical protein CM15mP79_2530 [Euryarchaeota archaeon]